MIRNIHRGLWFTLAIWWALSFWLFGMQLFFMSGQGFFVFVALALALITVVYHRAVMHSKIFIWPYALFHMLPLALQFIGMKPPGIENILLFAFGWLLLWMQKHT